MYVYVLHVLSRDKDISYSFGPRRDIETHETNTQISTARYQA